jgi:ACS family hexuronate transporter-like MFS transporter
VLVAWSCAGIATAYSGVIGAALADALGLGPDRSPGAVGATVMDVLGLHDWTAETSENRTTFFGLLVCRTVLGLFESGQWPCALITTQRILSREDRSFGNSILQSGASLGAIFTPIVVQLMMTQEPGSWRGPYIVIGGVGLLWMIPWLVLVRGRDLVRPAEAATAAESAPPAAGNLPLRRYLVLMVVVVVINMTWQFFRAWLPKFLKEFHHYDEAFADYFTSAYYIATDVGCITVGILVRWLIARGWDVHRARLTTFLGCSLLTALGAVAAVLPKGPLLLGLLLLIGAGALGLFPNYYAFGQEITTKHQGLVAGSLGTFTWFVTGFMQDIVGQTIKATGSYSSSMTLMGLAPLAGCVALWLFWDTRAASKPGQDASSGS